jgi:hypothetical protein
MSGQFTFYISTVVPSVEISVCAIAVFGTRYIRDEPLKSTLKIKSGDQSVFSVPHIHSEDVIGNQLNVELRQKPGSELSFVNFRN